ncbi:hypothetical protein DPMN_065548 [Dreissena polymorpha]|uniref:Uncharacterized protein n=1 Tax=Dreissena polymorpha TaxID=45954 RepID=A0A9D3YWP6_DREPO|nr:hypothetical protein DPMN_065548 [Dreissena polymorpha]
MCRNTLSKITNKSVDLPNNKRTREVAKHRDKVIALFERDENSRKLPGNADSVKTKVGTHIQKRVLTDYLKTLSRKFISENPRIKLSLSSFCRIRPRHIILTSLITRDTCLCTKHQKMSLTRKAVKRQHIYTPSNGENMLENRTELIKGIEDNVHEDTITVVSQWKRVQTEFKGQKKSGMKIVNSDMTKKEFVVEHVTKQSSEFEEHVSSIKTQYSQMKTLKENLPENHCIDHMDFSENCACESVSSQLTGTKRVLYYIR